MGLSERDFCPQKARNAGFSGILPQPVKVGQRVRAKNLQFLGHTRLVGYVKDKVGVVATDFGVFTLPDTMAHGGIPTPQHVYSIAFTSDKLWGPEADPKNSSQVGLWEDYLDAVGNEVSR